MPDSVAVRQGGPEDLERVAEIQALSPEASGWEVRNYLDHDFRVAVCGGIVAAFSVARRVSSDESELLNLAVDPGHRRKGLGTALLQDLRQRHPGAVFLEVRESNSAARMLYKSFGFRDLGRRPGYYQDPPEAAVVMGIRSCYCHR
ncbi:MAG TPA: ribosomal protein S18-alanine N-acetyltransferase [Bryobacteraceae bacterium]|nr:ribosomal protein S18-alanine N-acetyltransferase [Bryobacteraceae bacterium]